DPPRGRRHVCAPLPRASRGGRGRAATAAGGRRAVSGIPATLGRGTALAPGYPVLGHLHRGDALDVYEVWSEERNCPCIAKVLRPDRLAEVRPRRRHFREGRLLEQFTHPHIVRAYETLTRPQPVLILETLSGATLAYLIEVEFATKRFPVDEL